MQKIAIDLGTTYSIVYTAEAGVVLREPTALAIRHDTGQAIAFGDKAREMLGRTPERVAVVRPLCDGVIADFGAARILLRHFIRSAARVWPPFRRALMVCVPYGATPVEMEALRREALAAGSHQVELVKEPFAAALGARLPIGEPRGSLVIDIGGGTTEITVLSLNEVVRCESIRIAGTYMDGLIQGYLRQRHAFAVGDLTAEAIKISHGAVYSGNGDTEFEVKGMNGRTRMPHALRLRSHEIREALEPAVRQIVAGVKRCMDGLPAELANDIVAEGGTLVGGGALLRGWPERLRKETGLTIRLAEDPLMCVMHGLIEMLRNRERHGVLIDNSRHQRNGTTAVQRSAR